MRTFRWSTVIVMLGSGFMFVRSMPAPVSAQSLAAPGHFVDVTEKLGIHTSNTCDLAFDDVLVQLTAEIEVNARAKLSGVLARTDRAVAPFSSSNSIAARRHAARRSPW